GAVEVLGDAVGTDMRPKVVGETVRVETELARVRHEVTRRERTLMGQQHVVHLPERTLPVSRLGRLRSELRVWVHVDERQVAPDVPDLEEVRQQLAYGRFGLAAVRAPEVAVLA